MPVNGMTSHGCLTSTGLAEPTTPGHSGRAAPRYLVVPMHAVTGHPSPSLPSRALSRLAVACHAVASLAAPWQCLSGHAPPRLPCLTIPGLGKRCLHSLASP